MLTLIRCQTPVKDLQDAVDSWKTRINNKERDDGSIYFEIRKYPLGQACLAAFSRRLLARRKRVSHQPEEGVDANVDMSGKTTYKCKFFKFGCDE